MNKIEVIGNLGKDAEIKEIAGKQWMSFSVCDSRKQGENVVTTWFDVMSSNLKLQPYLTKGKRMFVRGQLSAKTYQTQTGESRVSLSVWANEIEFCGGGEQQQGQTQNTPQASPAYQQPQQVAQQLAQTSSDDLPF